MKGMLALFAATGLAAVTACGDQPATAAGAETTAGAEATARAAPIDPLALVPSEAALVVRADVARLRRSTHWPVLERWIARAAIEEPANARLEAVLETTELILLAAIAPAADEDGDRGIAVLRGHYEPGQLEAWVREGAGAGPVETATHAGRTLWIRTDAGVAAAELDPQTWLMGSDQDLRVAIDRADAGEALDGFPVATLQAMAERIAFGQSGISAVAAIDDPALRRELLTAARRGPLDPALLAAIGRVGVRLDADGPIQLEAIGEADSAAEAQALAQAVEEVLSLYGGHPLVRILGFGALFRGTSIRADGSAAVLRLDVAEADARDLLGQLDRLDELRRAVGGTGTMGPSEPATDPKGSGSTKQP